MPLPEISRIHDQYLALSRSARQQFAGSLGGKLLLSAGPNGLPAIVAASIAGAASLWVNAEGDALRGAMRAGLCDFVVGTLDEALRILKNEVRRKRAVSVGLQADPTACLRECVDRGFQPDLLQNVGTRLPREMQILANRGAWVLEERPQLEGDTSLLCWSVDSDVAKTMRHVGQMAAEALDPVRNDTAERLRWLEAAPRFLGRAFVNRQCLRMDHHESATFVARVQSQHLAVTFQPESAGT